jgi:hypothetical protein
VCGGDVSSGDHAGPPSRGEPARPAGTSGRALDAAVLCALKLAAGAWVLHRGFSHVSDDDYARTVIAEQFARAPRLDPSGTSWLPFPFWIDGWSMWVAGRSLDVARAVSLTLGAASVVAPYLAMRAARVPRATAAIAVASAMLVPWNVWLSVATVPEGWAGALVSAAVIAMPLDAARPWAAAALLVASLSRYEAWPACATLVALCISRAAVSRWPVSRWPVSRGVASRGADSRAVWVNVACALVAAAGPIAWMAWNRHAHGSAFHFLARVSAFRRAIGAANVPIWDKVIGYPLALLEETPEAAALGLVGFAGLIAGGALRERWRWPALAAAATIAFLVVGDLGDGAPTHHASRALAAVWWIAMGAGADALGTLLERLGSNRPALGAARSVVAAAWLAWSASLPARWDASPGRSDSERRDAQIARGLEMRARGVDHATVTPCAFEHFALLAAWGAPERATVRPRSGRDPRASVTEPCPDVVER